LKGFWPWRRFESSLNAEIAITQALAHQVALEIDREIVKDLLA
jgi:hypothetical protein